jgi:ATP-binding cassette, subfamily C, bacterial CydD
MSSLPAGDGAPADPLGTRRGSPGNRPMRPFDSRLTRHARAARGLLLVTVGLGIAAAVLIIAQAGLLARALAGAAHGIGPGVLGSTLAALLFVVAGRAAVSYASESAALRAAATVKSQLRRQLIARTLRLGPGWLGRQRAGEISTLATKGLDSLDTYFSRYLPQVILACLVPVAVLARIAAADWLSAVLIAVTLPLVPLFAVLVGLHTKAKTERQWRLLAQLGGHFLDVVEGLPTLKIFGQSRRQAEVIGEVTEEHRRATMSTLREAFLSALVLELAATLATALIAVEVGLRLLYSHIGYQSAMLILLLTPEAFLPLRAVGTFYHASTEGAVAAGQAFEILDTPAAQHSAWPATAAGQAAAVKAATAGAAAARFATADLHREEISLTDVRLCYPSRARPALDGLDLLIAPGEKVIVTGESGAGKSSLLALLLRFAEPAAGLVRVGSCDLTAIDLRAWRAQVSWLPQHPSLFAASIRDNIALGHPAADAAAVAAAARLAGADEFIEQLPDGYATQLTDRGLQLSAGERQRLALARCLLRGAPMMLLDEPTAHLDAVGATRVRSLLGTALADRTVIVATHDVSWLGGAARHVVLEHGRLAAAIAGPAGPRQPRSAAARTAAVAT